ncbi:endonuclease [Flavobacterium sp.]|uniref:endonuclease n=1 Tax=Flavobacterium sp. TaxID=239 RepID=UPI00374D7870
MKQKITILFLLISLVTFAQIPAGYYSTATGSGYVLKTQLYNIINGHTDRGYAGLWTTYGTSDRDIFTGTGYENDNTVYDIYTENPTGSTGECSFIYITDEDNGTGGTTECEFYNREHIVPQSVFGSLAPMVSDAHHIPPTDKHVNGVRANFPHGNVTTATFTSNNGGKLGNSSVSGYTGTAFEPNSSFKGDIARMYLYFATRYEDVVSGYSYQMFNGTSNQVFTNTFRDMLLAWHAADPVSAYEITRNNAIYARQNNRNPYIDHPEYVNMVWNPTPDTQNPTAATSLAVTGTTSNSVSLSWLAGTDNIGITSYDVYKDGVFTMSVPGLTAIVTGLTASTTYSFYVIARDAAGNSSPISNTVNGTTTASGGGNASELFFSEYVEGSSNNKALEIANFTGSPVDLATGLYSIKRQTNGAGAWSTGINLTGTLNNGSIFVIVNSLIAVGCYPTASANLSTSATEMTYNGNDPVGLFKNGILIDIVGVFNGGAPDFAINETIRRKSSITSPNTTFNKAVEWDSYSVDTCSDVGTHTFLPLSNVDFTESDFKIYPNPSNGNFKIEFNSSGDYSIEIFSLIGQKVFEEKESNKSSIYISHLQTGMYLVKVTKDNKSIVKKIVIN